MATAGKDTIYVDVDDEITSLIDKLRSSKQDIVALVLPKRASVVQSIVNMKLLKRSADEAKKKVVLITSEAGVLPLAGAVGIYVARTLSSKPELPTAPIRNETAVIDASEADNSAIVNKPVGELAGLPPDDDEAIVVEDIDELSDDKTTAGKPSPNKKLKVPNFERFRLLFIIGGAVLLLLIIGLFFAAKVLPRARVVIKTDTTTLNSDITFSAGTNIKQLDETALLIPATSKELKKSDTERVQTTGQKDIGEKAKGSVNLSLKDCSTSTVTIPAGTGVSTNNLTYVTQKEVTLSSVTIGGVCQNNNPSYADFANEAVDVVAQKAGDTYNISSGRTFNVAGYSGVSGTNGADITGGTSKIIKVVSQDDVDTAKMKMTERANATAADEVNKLLELENLRGITETLTAGTPVVTSTPAVNAEGSEAIVTMVTPYTMLGVAENDLKKLVENDIRIRIDDSKQSILDNGLSSANFKVLEKKPNGEMRINLKSIAKAGPQLDAKSIKQEIAGKKRGETRTTIQARPGIKQVDIKYSPFWVSSTPKDVKKIEVIFEGNDGVSQ